MAVATREGITPGAWHRLALRCEGSRLTGFVNGDEAVSVVDHLYPTGQVGLLAGGPDIEDAADLAGRSIAAEGVLSRPSFSDLRVVPLTEALAAGHPQVGRVRTGPRTGLKQVAEMRLLSVAASISTMPESCVMPAA